MLDGSNACPEPSDQRDWSVLVYRITAAPSDADSAKAHSLADGTVRHSGGILATRAHSDRRFQRAGGRAPIILRDLLRRPCPEQIP